MKGSKTISTVFLGKEAEFPAGPFYLATKFNVPVSFVFAMKERKYHYHFFASKPESFYHPQLNLKNRENDIRKLLSNYISAIEIQVKKYPSQWFNFYRFWKAA